MFGKKKRPEIGVYFFEGFLESGKTRYIQSLLEDDSIPEDLHVLVLQTEEGLEELEPVPGKQFFFHSFDKLEDITPEKLTELEDRYSPNTIMVELNGMWQEMDFFTRMPQNWYPFRKFVLADAGSFVSYNSNMRAQMTDKLREATVVVLNRARADTDRLTIHRIIRAASRQAPIFYQLEDGTEVPDETPDELPYDLNAPVVEIADRDYAEWERDISQEPEKYDGKVLRLRGFAVKGRDKRKGWFGFGRQVMTCCEADITFLGFSVVAAAQNVPTPGSWVELTCQVSIQQDTKGDPTPLLMAITCDKLEKPENTLATFY